ncbi:MAG: mechanosensitive ion channel family protein [Lysobacterales bacterium]
MSPLFRNLYCLLLMAGLCWPVLATPLPPPGESTTVAAAAADTQAQAEAALASAGLPDLQAELRDGAVELQGLVDDNAERERALAVVGAAVEPVPVADRMQLDPSLQTRIEPALGRLLELGRSALAWLPLWLVAALLVWLGWQLGRWLGRLRLVRALGRGNPYLAELAGQGVRLLSLGVGLLLALELLDLTAMVGALLGAAGVVGIALGFAFKDIIENHLAGILLSLRQPFAPGDHLSIDGHEGKVVGLTTRATLLMTLDGNHLRIPNSKVFNAVMLNYTRNPLRRFQFELGVGATDDLAQAQQLGIAAIAGSGVVSAEREPRAVVSELGDSNVVVRYSGWVDQRRHDFQAARSLCLMRAKTALEDAGVSLPEPQFRILLDGQPPLLAAPASMPVATADRGPRPAEPSTPELPTSPPGDQVEADLAIERQQLGEANLLKPQRDE